MTEQNQSKKSYSVPLIAVLSAVGIVLMSFASVWASNAYVYDEDYWKRHHFGDMTYTNTSIVKTGGSEYSLTVTVDGTQSSDLANHSVVVKNDKGRDKKPVFVRAFVIMNVYDITGMYNITDAYSNYVLQYDTDEGWVKREDGYYYYNKTLLNNTATSALIKAGSVKIVNTDEADGNRLPDGADVRIYVMADTLQAISTDAKNWTAADYYTTTEVGLAWGITPGFADLSAEDRKKQVAVSLTW